MNLSDHDAGKIYILTYLIQVAQKTEGAEVWRALFVSIAENIKLSNQKEPGK